MCEPISMTMGALGVAGAVTSGLGARSAAKSQAEHNRRLSIHNNKRYNQAVKYQQELADWQADNYYKNAASIADNAQQQYSTVLDQIEQVRQKTMGEVRQSGRAAIKGQSYIRAAASETGTTGNSVALAQQQYALADARFTNISFTNLSNRVRQSELQMRAIQSNAQNMLNRAMPAPMTPIDPVAPMQQVETPSMLPYIIQGGSSVLGAFAYQNNLDAMKGLGTPGTKQPVTTVQVEHWTDVLKIN